tara:strand:- start:388 stop:546 length:159 start_codon:yes stop_codon:yes gene_type:complete
MKKDYYVYNENGELDFLATKIAMESLDAQICYERLTEEGQKIYDLVYGPKNQ